jgi:hypothetical protein
VANDPAATARLLKLGIDTSLATDHFWKRVPQQVMQSAPLKNKTEGDRGQCLGFLRLRSNGMQSYRSVMSMSSVQCPRAANNLAGEQGSGWYLLWCNHSILALSQ